MNNITKLKKIENVKTYHGDIIHKDEYAYVDQPDNILEVLKDPAKVIPEVRRYIDENNERTKNYFKDVDNLQKILNEQLKNKEIQASAVVIDSERLPFEPKSNK